jgi:hypothetical protein
MESHVGFVNRELSRIAVALWHDSHSERHRELHAAQQALSWALEPNCFASPFDAITGSQPTPADCPDEPHLPLS